MANVTTRMYYKGESEQRYCFAKVIRDAQNQPTQGQRHWIPKAGVTMADAPVVDGIVDVTMPEAVASRFDLQEQAPEQADA